MSTHIKNRICKLIKQISDHEGGDDIEFLRDYCKAVINENKDDLLPALACFESLAEALNISELTPARPLLTTITCQKCGYVPPFCLC